MEAATARSAPARPAPRPRPKRRTTRPAQRRRASAKRPARVSGNRPARVMKPAMAGAALLPQAAVRSVGAVRDISDSSLILRLTRGRGWIAVLCALLGGIVALNVLSLSLTAGSGRLSLQIDGLKSEVSALQAQIDERLSAAKVETAASNLGMANPDPNTITYLNARDGDAQRLARLLSTDSFLTEPSLPSSYPAPGTSYAPVSPTAPPVTTTVPATTTPTATAPTTTTPAPTSGTTSGTSSGSSSGTSGSTGGSSGSTGGVGL
jgi:hypothetical protein